MTKLLVSVRSVDEAITACESGTDIIDIKEPNNGSLGRAKWSTIRSIVDAVRQSHAGIPVSVALGELADIGTNASALRSRPFDNVAFAKLGLAHTGNDWQEQWRDTMATVPSATHRVAVAYADWKRARSPDPFKVIAFARENHCRIVLVDTFCKDHGNLFDLLSIDQVDGLVREIHNNNMMSAMAGSLNITAIERLLPMSPDVVAVRGAACRGDRTATIDAREVRTLAKLVSPHSTSATH